MDARKLGGVAVGVAALAAALLGWRALAHPVPEAAPHDQAELAAPEAAATAPRPSSGVVPDAGSSERVPCADSPFAVPVGTELRYHLELGDGTEAQSAEYVLRLKDTHVEAGERVDAWQLELNVPGAEEPVETDFSRRCSEAGAQEPWMGVDFAGLSELLSQGWRWPLHLQAGAHFGGELRRQVMDQQITVEREHRVIGRESVSTPAGSFDAWRVELTDRASPGTPPGEGTAWVAEGVGLVRLRQPTAGGSFSLELVERSAS